jgi:hypothetical protein
LPVPQSPDAGEAPDDLGADLEAHWDAAEGATDTDTPDASGVDPSASAPGSAPSSSPEGSSADAGRVRGPDGKFIKAPAVDPAAPAPEFRVPEKWPAQVKERLAAIHAVNPEHAQFVLDQYAHFRSEAAQHVNRAQQTLQQFSDLLAPGRQQRALKNIDDATYVRNLIAAGDFLDKNPKEGLKYLAQTYGIDLTQLANPEAGGEPEIPPYVRQLQQENAQIKAFLATQVQGAAQQQERAASDWINQFASQVDTEGKPLYPHFDSVLDDIIVVVAAQKARGQQIDVKAAYDRAVRMNDSIWINDQRARSAAAEKAQAAQRVREIEEAKRAGFSVSGSGAATGEDIPDDLGDHLSRNYDKLSS